MKISSLVTQSRFLLEKLNDRIVSVRAPLKGFIAFKMPRSFNCSVLPKPLLEISHLDGLNSVYDEFLFGQKTLIKVDDN